MIANTYYNNCYMYKHKSLSLFSIHPPLMSRHQLSLHLPLLSRHVTNSPSTFPSSLNMSPLSLTFPSSLDMSPSLPHLPSTCHHLSPIFPRHVTISPPSSLDMSPSLPHLPSTCHHLSSHLPLLSRHVTNSPSTFPSSLNMSPTLPHLPLLSQHVTISPPSSLNMSPSLPPPSPPLSTCHQLSLTSLDMSPSLPHLPLLLTCHHLSPTFPSSLDISPTLPHLPLLSQHVHVLWHAQNAMCSAQYRRLSCLTHTFCRKPHAKLRSFIYPPCMFFSLYERINIKRSGTQPRGTRARLIENWR